MLWIKALHIFFVTSWFAGLFYLPRVLVNLAMETDVAAKERLLTMARKLYRFMTLLAVDFISRHRALPLPTLARPAGLADQQRATGELLLH